MKENYPEQIILEGEEENLRFEILEERQGLTGTTLVYDAEAGDNLFYRNDIDDWIEADEENSIYSGILNSNLEILDEAVLEYNRDEATAELLVRENEKEEKFQLTGYRAVNEGVLTDISPTS
jgi:hypothetical protein